MRTVVGGALSVDATPTEGVLRRRLLLAITLCCSVVLGLVMVEVLLRLAGRHPFPEFQPGRSDLPTTNVPDPVLGWRAKPGTYRYPGYTADAPPITLTLWPDGSRATSAERIERSRQVVLIGDSFTQGWAISDDETYGWQLQARFPAVEFVNYGTAGYNGVQALLRLQEYFAAHPHPPELVIYGFNDDQERRNVGEGSWLGLLAIAAQREMVRLPYCSLDGHGGLVFHPPEGYPMWPLRHRLALVPLLERAAFRVATHGRTQQKRAATERLIERMSSIVREHGSRLLVVLLFDEPDVGAHYTAYLDAHGIAALDCRIPGPWGALMVPGEGHPNGLANTKWAECLAPVLDRQLAHD